MNFKLTSLIFFFALFLTSAFAAGYSDTVIMDQNNFDIQFYNCGSDSKCSNPILVSQTHVNGTSHTFNYNTNNYYAEYIFKDGYLAKGFIVHKKRVKENSLYSELEFNRAIVRFEALFFTKKEAILKEYGLVDGNYITVYTLTPEELLQEKIAACLKRGKVRDIGDILWMRLQFLCGLQIRTIM